MLWILLFAVSKTFFQYQFFAFVGECKIKLPQDVLMETNKLSENIGIAIAGTGYMANRHAKCVKKSKQANLVAVYSRTTESRAKQFADKYSIRYYTNYEVMLSQADIDAVIIACIHSLHAELGIGAAKAGKHVLVEKPIGISLQEADEFIKTCAESCVKLSVVFQLRFDKNILRLKEAIDAGKFGQLMMGSVSIKWSRAQDYYDRSPWKKTYQYSGGGVLIMQAIHAIDILQWLLGPVAVVYGQMGSHTHDIEVEDTAVGILNFCNGALGIIEGTTSVFRSLPNRLEIHGEKGSVVLENNKIIHWTSGYTLTDKINDKLKTKAFRYLSSRRDSLLTAQLQDFIGAIKENRPPLVNGEEASKSLAIITALYSSSLSGKPVNL